MTELNLIPNYIKDKRQRTFLYKQYIALAVIILSILFLGLYFPWMKINSLKNTEDSLKTKIGSEQYLISKGQAVKNEIDTLNKYIAMVDDITKNRVEVTQKVRGIEKYIPSDITVQNLNYSNNEVNINGKTSNYNSVAEFVANLQQTNEYSTAKIASINYEETEKDYSFIVNIK